VTVADLVIEGGTVVRPGGSERADVYVKDGRIAAVTTERHDAAARVDASGLLVMPGFVDVHVHFMDPGDATREDFPSGSAGAAVAGVSTVVEHTHAAPVVTAGDLAAKREHLRTRSHVDFALGAHADPDRLDAIAGVWRAGAAFVKVFTCTTHGLRGFTAAQLHDCLNEVAAARAVALVHCEDDSITAAAESRLRASGRDDGGIVPEWRAAVAEQVAVAEVALLSRLTGARTVIAHASSAAIVALAVRERELGAPVAVETCPQYLTLFEQEAGREGALRKFTPPARARRPEDHDALWSDLAKGRVDYVSSDHAPSTLEQKRAGSIWDVHFGLPGIETTLPLLLDAAHAGRISYERLVEAYAAAPARLYGLAPRKGELVAGADADIVLVDPEHRRRIGDAPLQTKAGWSPYEGRTVTGRAVATYLRGEPAAEDGRPTREPGAGRFVAGPGATGARP
jgi:dihydroorotase (multifunctional complex type)